MELLQPSAVIQKRIKGSDRKKQERGKGREREKEGHATPNFVATTIAIAVGSL